MDMREISVSTMAGRGKAKWGRENEEPRGKKEKGKEKVSWVLWK
jgi:hypothetical protein